MLLRGQNIVGYRHYPDDTVKKFVGLAAKNGIDIFRIFDALNDPRNMQTAIKAVHKAGAHAQMSFSYTISPVHNVETFVNQAKKLEEMGADSICIKDMAGLLSPFIARELVTRLKEEISVPIQLHSHYTSGMASMAYLEAIQAGVDVVDTQVDATSQERHRLLHVTRPILNGGQPHRAIPQDRNLGARFAKWSVLHIVSFAPRHL